MKAMRSFSVFFLVLLMACYGAAVNRIDYGSIRTRSSTGMPVCDCQLLNNLTIPNLRGEKGQKGEKGASRRLSSNNNVFKRELATILNNYVDTHVQKGQLGPKGAKGFPGDDQVGEKGRKGDAASCESFYGCRYNLPSNIIPNKASEGDWFIAEQDLDVARATALSLPRYAKETKSLFIVIDGFSAGDDDDVYFYAANYAGLRKLNTTRVRSRSN